MFHVKHSLEETLNKLNIQTNNKKKESFLLYFEELLRWNKKINLISRKLTKEEVFKKLLLPSLIPYDLIDEGEKILDFGAGGGIASIPLKILKPNINLHLLESKNKLIIFLEHINLLLGLNLKIINKFVLKKNDLEEEYNWVFVRAVNPEQIPEDIAEKILYYGKYSGDKFTCKKKLLFETNTISILI
jgi:16S rRNA (guanine(527)-N(7))-methyltransferase RsmG